MTGFHMTSKEGRNYWEETCGRWKGILTPGFGVGGRLMGVPEKCRAAKWGTAQPPWGPFSAVGEGEAEKLLLEAQALKPEPWRLELAWLDCVLGRGKLCQTNFLRRGGQQKSGHFKDEEMVRRGGSSCLRKSHPDLSVNQILCCPPLLVMAVEVRWCAGDGGLHILGRRQKVGQVVLR